MRRWSAAVLGMRAWRVREISVPDFDGDAARELATAPKLEGEILCHGKQDGPHLFKIGCVRRKGAFTGNGLAFGGGDHG